MSSFYLQLAFGTLQMEICGNTLWFVTQVINNMEQSAS